jgi:hypothetical protein
MDPSEQTTNETMPVSDTRPPEGSMDTTPNRGRLWKETMREKMASTCSSLKQRVSVSVEMPRISVR